MQDQTQSKEKKNECEIKMHGNRSDCTEPGFLRSFQGYFMGAHCVLYAQYYWHDYTNCAESLKQGDGA